MDIVIKGATKSFSVREFDLVTLVDKLYFQRRDSKSV